MAQKKNEKKRITTSHRSKKYKAQRMITIRSSAVQQS